MCAARAPEVARASPVRDQLARAPKRLSVFDEHQRAADACWPIWGAGSRLPLGRGRWRETSARTTCAPVGRPYVGPPFGAPTYSFLANSLATGRLRASGAPGASAPSCRAGARAAGPFVCPTPIWAHRRAAAKRPQVGATTCCWRRAAPTRGRAPTN